MVNDDAINWRERGGWNAGWEVRRWLRSILSVVPGALGSWLRVRGHRFADCGRDVAIMEHSWIDFASDIHIGNHVAINRHVLLNGQGGIWIGDWSQIGPRVTIYTQNHDVDWIDGPRALRPDALAPVRIGSNCWIASSAILLAGVSIGDNSVVAAGAVVTRDVPPCSLAAGVPARVIRRIGSSAEIG